MRRREGSTTTNGSSNNTNGRIDRLPSDDDDEFEAIVQSSSESATTTTMAPPDGGNNGVSPPPTTSIKRKSGFLAFFNRKNDDRQIKKIGYPHDNNRQNSKNNNNHNNRRYFTDLFCVIGLMVVVGCFSFGSGGEFLPFLHRQLGPPQPRPTTKIPIELWQNIKGRRRLPLPLQLYGVLTPPTATTTATNQSTTVGGASTGIFHRPKKISHRSFYKDALYYKDYNDLDIRFLDPTNNNHDEQQKKKPAKNKRRQHRHFFHYEDDNHWKRTIYREPWETQGRARRLYQPRDDDTENYWAFDDDWLRNPLVSFDDGNIQDIHRCRRNNWTRFSFHTANLLHELDLLTHTPTLVGEGAYREVFIIERPVLGVKERFVLKEIRFDNDMEYDAHEYVRVDSLVTERMTSNEQIVNLYGYSGYSMLAECFVHGDVEEDIVGFDDRIRSFNPLGDPELRTWNNFTGSEKLKLALSMVQPVAALHNYKDGMIIHDDIQLSQFLWTDATKTSVKLNDFNRAEVLFWDEEYEQYCQFRNGRGGGDWRAPEEYRDKPLSDKIDVWSLGNNFYSLLGGYYPFFNVEKGEEIRHRISKGATAKIDPRFNDRSFAERKLVEIIKRCHVYDPEERADINEILQMLEDAIFEEESLQQMGLTGLEEDDVTEETGEYDDQYGYDDAYYAEEDSESHSEYSESHSEYEEESYSDYGEESHSDYENESYDYTEENKPEENQDEENHEEESHIEYDEESHGEYEEESHIEYEEESHGENDEESHIKYDEESHSDYEEESHIDYKEQQPGGNEPHDEPVEESPSVLGEVAPDGNEEEAPKSREQVYQNDIHEEANHDSYEYNGEIHDIDNPHYPTKGFSSSSSSSSDSSLPKGRHGNGKVVMEGHPQQKRPSNDRLDSEIKANKNHHGDSSL